MRPVFQHYPGFNTRKKILQGKPTGPMSFINIDRKILNKTFGKIYLTIYNKDNISWSMKECKDRIIMKCN
jgi:hypothetical protein